jgi:hypothetical protein
VGSESLLQTHAEVAVALAGFASVVAALRRPLSGFARQRFLSLLGLALIQVLGCLLPLWVLPLFDSASTAWRLLSFALLIMYAVRFWWLVALPTGALRQGSAGILNPLVSKLAWGSGLVVLPLLAINTLGFPFDPSFDLYYAAHLSALMLGFALFADVAVAER